MLVVVLALAAGAVMTVAGDPKAQQAEPATGQPSRRGPLGQGGAATGQLGSGTGELFFKTMGAVLLVVGMGAVAILVSKKLLPRIGSLPGKEIRVLETAYLGPRKAVHLVEVGSQRLLIGSTNENIATLAHLSDTWTELVDQRPDGGAIT